MHRIAHLRRAAGHVCVPAAACFLFAIHPISARAVVVRGSIRDPLGRPIASAHVQLVKGRQIVGSSVTMSDGTFEIRSTDDGRFIVIADAVSFSPQIGTPFYGGQLDVVTQDLSLTISPIKSEVTVTAAGEPIPLPQASASIALVDAAALSTRVGIVDELRLQPGVALVQTGQYGGATSLFVRGANSDANKVLIDDVPANDVGGVFDYGNVSSTAVRGIETQRGPDSVLYGTDARAGVIRIDTPQGMSLKPILTYSGDAGNLHTWRNEGALSGTYGKADYFTAFSRFDSSNALVKDRFHAATTAANLGYHVTANTSIRGTARYAVTASGLPGPFDFQGVVQSGKQADQDLYLSGVLDDTRSSGWHNTVRYLDSRKREQSNQYSTNGTPDGYGEYFGTRVTIRGANGTSATGNALIGYDPFPTHYEFVNNRDGLEYTSSFSMGQHLAVLGGFRFQDERGAYRYPLFGTNQQISRTNYDYTLEFHGDLRHRLFYTLGGAVQHNSLYGTEGQPQLGLTYSVVQPGRGWLQGTRLRVHFAKGVQEPGLSAQLSSLYVELLAIGDTGSIASFHVSPIGAQRSRVYEGGVDQNLYSDRAVLHLTYFHSTFGRGTEYVSTPLYNGYFHQTLPPSLYGFYLNSLDTKSSGMEAALEYQCTTHVFLRAGYTYLDAKVARSFSADAINALGGVTTVNPRYPGVAIGVYSPLVGQRPFRRPPQTGFAVLQYTGARWSAAIKAAMVSKADDSTFIDQYSNANFDTSMLLPNRNLDFGYTRLDSSVTYQWKPSVAVFTQLDNLLNNQHIGPIGYPSLPFTFRVGLKLRFPQE